MHPAKASVTNGQTDVVNKQILAGEFWNYRDNFLQ